MNHLVFIVLDSARFDHVKKAKTPWLDRLGRVEKRYSFASWTSPSHLCFLMGQLPHKSLRKVLPHVEYLREIWLWKERLALPQISFGDFLPEMSLPLALKRHGYSTHGIVSLPALNPASVFSAHFDSYKMMPKHNEFHKIIEKLDFSGDSARFYFLNVGETHYPYVLWDDQHEWYRLHGLHGIFAYLDKKMKADEFITEAPPFFTDAQLKMLKKRQIECIEYVDTLLEHLYKRCPPNTHLIVTSDHGELFGEDDMFGHGPVFHRKVFEVPFVEGLVPRINWL